MVRQVRKTGVTAMIHSWWNPKGYIVAAAIALFACVAVIVGIGLVDPEPVSSAALGPD